MASLLLTHGTFTLRVPLPATCLVGRAAGCLARVADPAVPSHWLELRWADGQWRWRALAGAARTRGVGMLAEDGWRNLPTSTEARPQRVRLDDVLSVELLEGGAPEAFLVDLMTGEVRTGAAMTEVVEAHGDGTLLPFAAEGRREARLHDGDVVMHEGKVWRVHPAETPEPTARVAIDLARPGASVDIAADGLRVTVHQGEADVSIAGEHVRVLTAYAMARRDDDEGGWLGADAAWERWRALGGNPQSPVDRLGWDRGRCRAHLARLGVGNVDLLFETRRMQGTPQVRLGLRVE